MSTMTGILSRTSTHRVPEDLFRELCNSLNKHGKGKLIEHRSDQFCVAKIDLGIFPSPGFHVDPTTGMVSAIVGEPYLVTTKETEISNREKDLICLHEAFKIEQWDILRNACGIFSIAHYNPTTNVFTLATDKLGIRPVYVWYNEKFLVFSTLLRVLEEVSFIPKTMDALAVAQMIRLGYPLGRRTPYADIDMFESAEQLTIKNGERKSRIYHQWDDESKLDISNFDLPQEVQKRFVTAIKRRLKGQMQGIAFLSGGLDSRCVVSALRELNVDVHSYGFSLPATQDDVFAHLFAKRTGCNHHSIGRKERAMLLHQGQWSFAISDAIAIGYDKGIHHKTRNAVWSGDGGSVSVGFVYFERTFNVLLQQGHIKQAIDLHLLHNFSSISKHVLSSKVTDQILAATTKGIETELDKIKCNDPIRRFNLYLMKNDQRRHLVGHFETIDQHGIELILPFFDSNFLDLILRLPTEQCLAHRFYHLWLREMHPSVTAVPWQTYPGHEACPVPAPQKLGYQWDKQHAKKTINKKYTLQRGVEILREKKFPHSLLNKFAFRLFHLTYRLGLRNSNWALETMEKYIRYSKMTSGRYTINSAEKL